MRNEFSQAGGNFEFFEESPEAAPPLLDQYFLSTPFRRHFRDSLRLNVQELGQQAGSGNLLLIDFCKLLSKCFLLLEGEYSDCISREDVKQKSSLLSRAPYQLTKLFAQVIKLRQEFAN